MLFRHLKNILPRQNNSKTKLRCPEDALRRLGKVGLDPTFLLRKKSLTNENSAKSHFVRKNSQVENQLNRPS